MRMSSNDSAKSKLVSQLVYEEHLKYSEIVRNWQFNIYHKQNSSLIAKIDSREKRQWIYAH